MAPTIDTAATAVAVEAAVTAGMDRRETAAPTEVPERGAILAPVPAKGRIHMSLQTFRRRYTLAVAEAAPGSMVEVPITAALAARVAEQTAASGKAEREPPQRQTPVAVAAVAVENPA